MSRDFPDWVNPWSAAEGRRIFRGTLPFKWMRRLAGLLADDTGQAEFRAAFHLDAQRRPVIELWVRADLPLVCQASLETYLEHVERDTVLCVVTTDEGLNRLPAHYEPVQAGNGALALADIVEDELLLGMPQIPRKPGLEPVTHQSGETPAVEAGQSGSRKPFSQLGELLRRQQDTN